MVLDDGRPADGERKIASLLQEHVLSQALRERVGVGVSATSGEYGEWNEVGVRYNKCVESKTQGAPAEELLGLLLDVLGVHRQQSIEQLLGLERERVGLFFDETRPAIIGSTDTVGQLVWRVLCLVIVKAMAQYLLQPT